MNDSRPVTERDIRIPEFRDAKLDDLEFRHDGKIVRKDRWETAIHKIAQRIGLNGRAGFEIPDVVTEVERLYFAAPLTVCQADVDGDCYHDKCPRPDRSDDDAPGCRCPLATLAATPESPTTPTPQG